MIMEEAVISDQTYDLRDYNHYIPIEWQPPSTTTTWTTWVSDPRCDYCDGLGHASKPEICPRVKSIKYFEDGTVAEIKFHKSSD